MSLALTALVPSTAAQAVTLDSEEAAFCRLINDYRAQNGLGPLLVSTALTNAAEWHSTDMAQKNYFSHTDSLGRDPFQRMAAFGYSYPTARGENIAAGSATAAATLTQWKNSPGHNANMLSSSYTVMGIGRAYGGTSQYGWYWTNTFGGHNDGGTPCPSAPPPPTLSVNDVSVTEGDAGTKTATFTVTRSGDTSGTSSVSYATANNTATAGSDYVGLALTRLSFAAGETTKTVAVTINGDTVVEPTETFFLNLSSPTGATISDGSGTGTIQNDDSAPAPTLSVSDMSITEGNSRSRWAFFTVTRSGDTSGTATFNWSTADITANAGSDYQAADPTITAYLHPGETSRAIAVIVNGDTAPEPNETFALNLHSVTGATIADGSAIGTIQNDDAGTASLKVNNISFSEGNSSGTTGTFTVTRMGDTSGPSSVRYATADGTATAGIDYVGVPLTTLNFAPGETTKAVAVTSIGDTTPEPAETFFLKLSSPTGATIFDDSGTATLNNADDGLVT